jgi:leucyl/phenylalanyl-tRNA--protein transferase
MFAHAPDASKVAFSVLLGHLIAWGFRLVDCQVHTEHLERFGARAFPRTEFLSRLREGIGDEGTKGPWQVELSFDEVLSRLPQEATATRDPSER